MNCLTRDPRRHRVAIDTGRRPAEICGCRWDCLTRTRTAARADLQRLQEQPRSDAGWRSASHRRGDRRTATAGAGTLPDTPLAELALLPTARRNPAGAPRSPTNSLASAHRRWVDRMPVLRTGDGIEFDKSEVVPYAYRHIVPA